MASTALNEEEIKEHYDEPHVLEKKINRLVDLIRNADHFVAFTGAGISTSAGTPLLVLSTFHVFFC